jgi:hypothetical protein
MRRAIFISLVITSALLPAWLFAESNHAKGLLTVDGKPLTITQAYAFAQKGFFDPTKDDVVVLLCDATVSPEAVRDPFARRDLVTAGKLHCVQQTINSEHQVINFKVEDSHFKMPETGGSTEQVFEPKDFAATNISGRAFTKSPQKSFDDVPYTYDITFNATIEPKK